MKLTERLRDKLSNSLFSHPAMMPEQSPADPPCHAGFIKDGLYTHHRADFLGGLFYRLSLPLVVNHEANPEGVSRADGGSCDGASNLA